MLFSASLCIFQYIYQYFKRFMSLEIIYVVPTSAFLYFPSGSPTSTFIKRIFLVCWNFYKLSKINHFPESDENIAVIYKYKLQSCKIVFTKPHLLPPGYETMTSLSSSNPTIVPGQQRAWRRKHNEPVIPFYKLPIEYCGTSKNDALN